MDEDLNSLVGVSGGGSGSSSSTRWELAPLVLADACAVFCIYAAVNSGTKTDTEAPPHTDHLLAWSGISCTYPATRSGMEDKQTLSDAYGELRTGDLVAIMGPSGGKSTLMDVLAGPKETGNVTGTPEESVMFVAGLTHGKTSVVEARRLLYDVGLRDPDLYTRPIGGSLAGGLVIRGLSGGERKLLALACALAMKPRLIMLDEITSTRLDSIPKAR
ncbi:transporter G family member 7 [Seminavis robusta]|uniref:Transporter G family member 7 n=1 Tax=Seminavis robusta TaxID=568900 RepID=A0A9N8H9Z5_9STRA|nr:transporter G family member 7 [Seminavis robusta]|eukprot:Sro223_g091480.1 transporter G family member 7 (217) ;mRNA; r:81609-82540